MKLTTSDKVSLLSALLNPVTVNVFTILLVDATPSAGNLPFNTPAVIDAAFVILVLDMLRPLSVVIPLTSNVVAGVVVPMPTLPEESMRRRSVFPVASERI